MFETGLNKDGSTLLFQENASFNLPRGLGVWHNPPTGGSYRPEGGQFVFISGRPYRYNAGHLRANVAFILNYLMHEPTLQGDGYPIRFSLEQNYPNPFNTTTTIRYFLYDPTDITLNIYNIQGELVGSLLDEESNLTGFHSIVWDGKNESGIRVSSGIYFYQLNTKESGMTKKMLLLK